MYSANARVFSVCSNRAQLLKRSVQSQILSCVCVRFTTCTVHRRKKTSSLPKATTNIPFQKLEKVGEEPTGSREKRKARPPLSNLFTPVNIEPSTKSDKVGEELTGSLDKSDVLKVINAFNRNKQVKLMASENGIDDSIYTQGLSSFRKYCLQSESLPADLHVTLSDIVKEAGNAVDIFPYFLRHVREMYPHLDCLDELKKVGDVREPPNWFPETRNLQRKFYFHCGPTNSGKTFQAIQSFLKAKSGIYCAPLKLLAVEVYQKTNKKGILCDLVTGEEAINANPNGDCSSHISCTIEMCSLEKSFDVAIIDEIQMLRDPQRGWAWTRALLGLKANEIHVCGEESAIDIVDSILCTTGEKIEVKHYERLTKLHIDNPLESLAKVRPGDCIVCFNKSDIFSVTKTLEALNHNCAIIYGSLPPHTKLSQCENFNDPNHPCKLLVATDAIGMGLNLFKAGDVSLKDEHCSLAKGMPIGIACSTDVWVQNLLTEIGLMKHSFPVPTNFLQVKFRFRDRNIRRIIFYSLLKISFNNSGEAEKKIISVSQALQIAGRAGRFGSNFEEGFVTTFREKDLKTLELLLSQKPEKIFRAGLHPTVDQIELFSYYLPKSSLSELVEIFYNLCTVDDSLYFMCDLMELKILALLIDHIPLPLKVKYVFCSAPVNRKMHFVSVMFVGFAKMYSLNQVVDAKWISRKINWPLEKPKNWRELGVLESYHEVLDLYLWLSYRFEEYFPDATIIRSMQRHIDSLIQYGVLSVKKLVMADADSKAKNNNEEVLKNKIF